MTSTSGHLVELRQRLIVSFCAVFLFAAVSYFFAEDIARFFMTRLPRTRKAGLYQFN